VVAVNYSLLWVVAPLIWHKFVKVYKKKPTASIFWVWDQKSGSSCSGRCFCCLFYRAILNKQEYRTILLQNHNINFHENSFFYFQAVTARQT
jgi:hypothetical protein